MDVNDTNNVREKLERERDLLESSDIDADDKDAIESFVEHRETIEERSLNTLISDMGTLRRASDRIDGTLLEADLDDARAFIGRLSDPKDAGGWGLDPDGGGVYGYKRALRVFYNWLDEERDGDRYDFGERIELPTQDYDDTIRREDLLSEAQIEDLKAACKNERDPVLIDFLADVGARISLATSLRVGDVEGIDGPKPTFHPNENAIGLKGVEDRDYPILYSRAELRQWINRNHPDPHPEAPLFPLLNGYDPEDRQHGAVGVDGVESQLDVIADRAGIDVNVHPHHFRHVFMTRVANSDIGDRDLQHMTMLNDNELRMLDVYDHTKDDERNSRIFETHGFVDPDAEAEEDAPEIEMVQCYNCRGSVKSTARYCPHCSIALEDALQEAIETTRDATLDDSVDAEDRDRRETARDVAKAAEADPDLAEALAEEFGRLGDS